MKTLLYIDCCIRGEQSRTRKLAEKFLDGISKEEYQIERLDLCGKELLPLNLERLQKRDELLQEKAYDHEMFALARQFANADMVVIAAPFWDLSFPAQLKIYIENISVGNITFGYNESGMVGLCRGEEFVFVTTRGGIYKDSALENGSRYMDAIRTMFGFSHYQLICEEGLDIVSN